jgi:hypothetical protein
VCNPLHDLKKPMLVYNRAVAASRIGTIAIAALSLCVVSLACDSLSGLSHDGETAAPARDAGEPDAEPSGGDGGDGGTTSGDGAACSAVLATDAKNCGACGHDCFGGACNGGKCEAVKLATIAAGGASAVRLVGTNLVVLRDGGIDRVPRAGGSTTSLYSGVGLTTSVGPWLLSTDSNYAYYVTTEDMSGQVHVRRCALGGCFTGDQPSDRLIQISFDHKAIDVDPTHALISGIYGPIRACSPAGCDGGTSVTPSQEGKEQVVLAGAHVVWTNSFNRSVYRCPRTGCAQETELVGSLALPSEPGPIAAFGDKVYFATTGVTTKIFACAVTGCSGTPEVISDALGAASTIAVDATGVYWTVPGPEGASKGFVATCALGKDCGAYLPAKSSTSSIKFSKSSKSKRRSVRNTACSSAHFTKSVS